MPFSRLTAMNCTNATATRRRFAPTAFCSYPAEPDLAAQVRLAFTNLNAILAEAGSSFEDVVDTTIFIIDPDSKFETIWEVAAEYWGEAPYPTATVIGVTWLSGFDFEIKVIAKLPQ